jgi:Na+-transporting NADH:ubiquinone oxidoreductase subunit NqrF
MVTMVGSGIFGGGRVMVVNMYTLLGVLASMLVLVVVSTLIVVVLTVVLVERVAVVVTVDVDIDVEVDVELGVTVVCGKLTPGAAVALLSRMPSASSRGTSTQTALSMTAS